MTGLIIVIAMMFAPQPAAAFDTSVKTILEKRCRPCHFAGGKMYERLPFEKAETIVKLGTKSCSRGSGMSAIAT